MTKAMILAAGAGRRMGELTKDIPKPLLKVNGKCLIEYHLERLAENKITEVVINTAYRGEQIRKYLGSGQAFGVSIEYSNEAEALETAGGIIKALPLFNHEPFIVVNADIWTDFPFRKLIQPMISVAHIILVQNPEHHPRGDFSMNDEYVCLNGSPRYTYSGISYYDPRFFENFTDGYRRLGPLLIDAAQEKKITAEIYQGKWFDVGTPDRLAFLQKQFAS